MVRGIRKVVKGGIYRGLIKKWHPLASIPGEASPQHLKRLRCLGKCGEALHGSEAGKQVMEKALFHEDGATYFDHSRVRRFARERMTSLQLIQDAKAGIIDAARALKTGFWPFVREFETVIDRREVPREPLVRKFGRENVRAIFGTIVRALREMKVDEGSHAAHWQADAQCLGICLDDRISPRVQALIDRAYTEDLPQFFAMLAATEYVAEELSAFLVPSKPFTDLFERKRWVWGEVHLQQHDGPSHLDFDLDLARAYSAASSPDEIERMVLDAITSFETAAIEVDAVFRSG
jgi:hypothetical protein